MTSQAIMQEVPEGQMSFDMLDTYEVEYISYQPTKDDNNAGE